MTTSTFVRISGGVVAPDAPYTVPTGTNMATVFGTGLTFADVTALGSPPAPGSAATETGGTWSFVVPGGGPSLPVTVPSSVSRFQLKSLFAATSGSGGTLLDNVNTWVATQAETSQVIWSDAGAITRAGSFIAAMAAHFSWSSGTVDGYFEAAILLPTAG